MTAMLYSTESFGRFPVTTSPSSLAATPAMRQYLDAKRQHRDAIVLFRMGDFYEMFFEDAITASRVLELTLTSRSKDTAGSAIPMCGMPYHAVDGYLSRLIRKGYRVAICEQVEDPKKAKGLVKREVTRVVSPGTFTDAGYLDAREPAFLAAVAQRDGIDQQCVSRQAPRDVSHMRQFHALRGAEIVHDGAGRRRRRRRVFKSEPRQ